MSEEQLFVNSLLLLLLLGTEPNILPAGRHTDEAECKSHSTQMCPNTPSGLLILIVLCMCMCVCSCFVVYYYYYYYY